MKHLVSHHKSCVLSFSVLLFLLLQVFSTGLLAAPSSLALAGPPPASLSKTELSARGRQESILTIMDFGRYAITVKSEQGTGLQLIDRMAGPGEISGEAGEKDGRLDVFLEKGKYKIITYGHEKASGSAHLEVHPFTEKSAPQPSVLVDLKLIEAALKDLEQLSYWVQVKVRRQVILEAAGRSLTDMRLWKDGKWLLDAAPAISTAQPKTGQPLRICRLTANLEPGLYLLTAYGGISLPWANDSGLNPFYLRAGIRELGSVTRRHFTVSPFGTDHFIVPGNSTYFRLELPEAREASLRVGWYDQKDSFKNNGPMQNILKNSIPPVAELSVNGSKDAKHILTITGEADMSYVLQHFESNDQYSFQGSGDYWISSVHSGHPQDSIDATAILTSGYDTRRTTPMLAQTVELDQMNGYTRRTNLLGPLTLFLRIKAKGSYQILSQGVEARFVIEPFLTYRPPVYSTPDSHPGGFTWELDAGYYVLTIEPVKKGILDLIIRPASLISMVFEKIFSEKGDTAGAVRAAVRFPKVSLDRDTWYKIYMSLQPEVETGLVIRPLPLDLTDPLPVTQTPGETVSVPFQISEEGTLKAEAEDGTLMDIALDNGPWQKKYNVGAGRHDVSVRSAYKDTINYALLVEPRRLDPGTPLPALPDAALAGLPDFPVLTDNAPRFFDMERNSSSTFIIRADKPGLYQIQSSGLMAMSGDLRSRTDPSFVQESENGHGRNFLIQQYLREGDYQITVTSKGQSRGHLGLTMTRTDLVQGGFITNRTPARISLPAGKAAAYHFIITNPGEYRLRAFGLGREIKCRLEDKDGWPVEPPNIAADITRTFEKGQYRLIILPENTEARIVTVIEQTPRPRIFKGHGPHTLPLAVSVEHTWLEPDAGQERLPDQWKFDLPAAADLSIELTGEMQADLLKMNQDQTTTRAAFIPPARGWKGILQAGVYKIDVASMRVNNQAPYRLTVRPAPLMAGLSREISVPSIVPIAIGQNGLVEISSFGSIDVKARLMNDEGLLVASNDDRPDDWNFHIAANLKPGTYRLSVDPVGAVNGSCTVLVRAPKEEEKSAIMLPAGAKIKLSRSVQLYPISLSAKGELLVLSARAPENVSLAVEAEEQGGWKTIGSSFGRNAHLEIPLRDPHSGHTGTRYRLRLWSMDRRDTVADLSASLVSPPAFREADLKKGIVLSPAAPGGPVAAAVVKIERSGLLHVPDEFSNLRWSADPLRPCEEVPDNLLSVRSGYVWITGETLPGQTDVPAASAGRMRLGSGEEKAVQIQMPDQEKVTCDIAGSAGGPVLFIASSRIGRPAVELIEQGKEDPVNIDSLVIGEHGSISVSLHPKKPVARLWAASRFEEPFEVRLSQISFNAPERIPLQDGGNGEIEGIKAQLYDLTKGQKRIMLSLGEALAAVLLKDDRIISIHWAEGNSFTETLESDADQMLLLHTRKGKDRFSVEHVPLSNMMLTLPLAIGKPYEKLMLNSGRLRLRIAPENTSRDNRRTLHVRGSEKDPVFTDQSGNVLSGSNLEINDQGGTLVIEHEPGVLLCWLDRPGEEAVDLWASPDRPDAAVITPPVVLPLEGNLRIYKINVGKPVMLHVRGAEPLITYLARGGTPEVEVFPKGVVLDAYLPNGSSELRLRALSGSIMSGQVDISSSPVIPADEGLGPEILLAPGGARLFSFKVEQESNVGAGVKSDSDIINMEIMNNSGMVIGKGSAQMLHLKPGTYLMKLQAPDSSTPVRARPALVGLRIPDTGPPKEEIQKYLSPDEEIPLAYSSQSVSGPQSGRYKRTKRAASEWQGPETGDGEDLGEGTDSGMEPGITEGDEN